MKCKKFFLMKCILYKTDEKTCKICMAQWSSQEYTEFILHDVSTLTDQALHGPCHVKPELETDVRQAKVNRIVKQRTKLILAHILQKLEEA